MMRCDGCGKEAKREGVTLLHADGSRACVALDGIVHTTATVGDDPPRCDFCNRIEAVNQFIITGRISASVMAWGEDLDPSSLTFNHSDDWAICDGCVECAERRDFIGVVDRYLSLAEVTAGPLTDEQRSEVRSAVGQLHSEVWTAWDGKFHRWS